MRPVKGLLVMIALVALLPYAGGAQEVAEVRNEAKFGTWKRRLNEPPPRTETRVYENRGTGVTLSTRSGVNAQGEPFFSQYASKVDGKDYPRVVMGSGAVSSIALGYHRRSLRGVDCEGRRRGHHHRDERGLGGRADAYDDYARTERTERLRLRLRQAVAPQERETPPSTSTGAPFFPFFPTRIRAGLLEVLVKVGLVLGDR